MFTPIVHRRICAYNRYALLFTKQQQFQPFLHSRPFAVDDAEVHRVAEQAVPSDHVIAKHAFPDAADPRNSPL